MMPIQKTPFIIPFTQSVFKNFLSSNVIPSVAAKVIETFGSLHLFVDLRRNGKMQTVREMIIAENPNPGEHSSGHSCTSNGFTYQNDGMVFGVVRAGQVLNSFESVQDSYHLLGLGHPPATLRELMLSGHYIQTHWWCSRSVTIAAPLTASQS